MWVVGLVSMDIYRRGVPLGEPIGGDLLGHLDIGPLHRLFQPLGGGLGQDVRRRFLGQGDLPGQLCDLPVELVDLQLVEGGPLLGFQLGDLLPVFLPLPGLFLAEFVVEPVNRRLEGQRSPWGPIRLSMEMAWTFWPETVASTASWERMSMAALVSPRVLGLHQKPLPQGDGVFVGAAGGRSPRGLSPDGPRKPAQGRSYPSVSRVWLAFCSASALLMGL